VDADMTKSDYIHLFKEACAGKCNAEYNPCAFRQAADSLVALKPVAWMIPDYNDVLSSSETDGTGIYNIPLYALKANNEDAPLP
jgi:hypothetical protein